MRRSGVYIVNEPRENINVSSSNGHCKTRIIKMADVAPDTEADVDNAENIELTGTTDKKKVHAFYKSALTKLLCGLYALILISLGIVFSLADALTARERAHRFYLEGFLLYLYVVSFLFLLYFQIVLLRGVKSKPGHYDANVKVTVRRSTENINASLPNSPQIDPKKADTMEKGQEKAMDKMSVATDITNHLELPVDGGVAHVAEGINFYLRLGALAFSLGSVTLDGFQIASYFESDYTRDCKSIIFIPVYGTHLFFTFVQTFFLFKNHKVVIDRHKACVRFGMMHLVATNLCVWIMTVVTETSEEHRYRSHQQLAEAGLVPIGYNSCYEGITLARAASPYLFPCTIIYSIIASGILHKMYQYIGVKVRQKWPSHLSLTSSQPYGAASLDCEKANKGLFMGLLVAVLTAIAIATFFVFESRLNDFSTAIKLFYITQISLIVITAIGIMFGYGRLSKLKFVESYFLSLDAILLLIALCGCYVYYSFTLISIATKFPDYFLIILLAMVTIGIELIQITFQTVFVLDGLCRCADSDEQMITKPGRAVITFLLISNVALWAVSMFEMKKTMMLEIYEMFYGILPWNIITHICVPLIIFFRFHSAICLSKVWYQAYQKEKLI